MLKLHLKFSFETTCILIFTNLQIHQKRILFINLSDQISGAEISLKLLIENIDSNKFNSFLASPINFVKSKKTSFIPIEQINLKKSNSVIYFIKVLYSIVRIVLDLIKLCQNEKIDLIVANTTKANLIAVWIKLILKIKLIWIVRDNIENKVLIKLFSKKCDLILCTSEYISNQILTYNTKKLVIPNFVNPLNEIKTTTSLRDNLGLKKEDILIAQIGQLIPWKNHIDSIKAFEIIYQSHKNAYLLFIGGDLFKQHKKYISELQHYISEKSLNNNIKFIGSIENWNQYCSEINIVIHPSKSEPFGRVIIESMLHGIPVVSYNLGGPLEIIIDNYSGMLADNSVGHIGLSEKIKQLIDNPKLTKFISENAITEVNRKYTMKDIIPKIEKVFLHV